MRSERVRSLHAAWIGPMTTRMRVYEGHVDATGKVLALECEGPDFSDVTRRRRYRDIIAIPSDDKRTLTPRMLAEDGSRRQATTADCRRKS